MRKMILISFLSQSFGFMLHYFTLFVLVRTISVQEFGLFQKFNLFLTTILPFIGFTLVSSLYYFYPRGDEKFKSRIITQTLVLLCITGFGFFGLMVLAKNNILAWLQLDALSFVPGWIFLTVPFYLVATLSDNIFLLEKKNKVLLFYLPAEKLLFLLSIMCLYFINRSIESVFYGIFLFSIIRLVFIVTYISGNHSLTRVVPQKKDLLQQLKYCIPFYVANVAYTLSIKFDKLYLNKFITTEEFAIYSISFLSIPLLANAFNSINNVAMTEITTHMALGEKEKVRVLYRNIVTKTSALAIPFMVYFFINASEIITVLFTEKYLSAAYYYRIYLFTFLVALTSYGLILRASGKTRLIFVINIIASIVSVGAGFFLIPAYGMTGGIITAVIAMWLPGFLQLGAEMKHLKFTFFQFFPVRNFLTVSCAALLASPVILLIQVFRLMPLIELILSAIVYFGLVIVFLYLLKLLPFQDKLEGLKRKLMFQKTK